jgi:Xaa-Pro aminopeptidase
MILSAIVKQNQVDALFINNPINLKAILKEGYSDFGIIIVTKTQIHCFIDIRDYDKCCRLVDKNICMHLFTKPNDLIDFLKTKKITSILLESNHLSIDDFDTYIKPLKIKTIKRINFNFIRMVKTDEELKYLQKSADIIADGINHIRK